MFTHGVTGDHPLFKKQIEFWSWDYTVIVWDMPLHGGKQAAKVTTKTKESYLTFYDCLVRLGKQGMLESADAVYKDFSNYEEVDFQCSVLLLLGEDDNLGYVKKYNKMWTKETGYPVIIIPNARHNSNYDNYEVVNRVIYEFLQPLRQNKRYS